MKRYALLLLIFVMAIFGTGFETEMVNCADISSETSSDGNSINTIPMNEQVDAQNEIMSTETTSYDYVYLKNCASGRCLDVRGAKTAENTKTIIFAKGSSFQANQVWKIIPNDDGSVYLQSVLHPERYLAISTATNNVVTSISGTRWIFQSDGEGSYTIVEMNGTSRYIGTKDDLTSANTEVVVANTGLTNSKKWIIEYIENYTQVGYVKITNPTELQTYTELLSTGTISFGVSILPEDATNRKVTWQSLNPDIATINEVTGVATLLSTGTVTFVATANDGTTFDICRVHVIGDFYYIRNYGNNRYFDIANNGTESGTNLLHWSFHGSYNQIMKIVKREINTFSIHPVPSMNSKALTVTSSGVELADYTGELNQHFIFSPSTNQFERCRISVKDKNEYLIPDSTDNKRIIYSSYATDSLQEWTFEKYETKALTRLNFGAYSLQPDANYNFLAYNSFMNNMANFTLNGQSYVSGASWKGNIEAVNGVPAVSKNDILTLMPYSDIVYIDSHGALNGSIGYYDGQSNDLISFNDIGIDFTNAEKTKTNSIFNKKTKWVIISACSQLDLEGKGITDKDGATNTVYNWAKAMLGDGERLHGVLGYHSISPGDTKFKQIIDRFFENQANGVDGASSGESLITSWAENNYYVRDVIVTITDHQSWAALYHKSNVNDSFGQMSATTENGSSYIIERISSVVDDAHTFVLASNNVSLSISDINNKAVAAAFDDYENGMFPSSYISIGDGITLMRVDNQGVRYKNTNNTIDANSYVSLSSQAAAQSCLNSLCDMGVLENGNYTTHVTPIVKDELDVVNETTKDEEVTIGYQMTFVPQVSSLGEGNNTDSYECVKLLYTNDSISSFMYYDELQDEGVELK